MGSARKPRSQSHLPFAGLLIPIVGLVTAIVNRLPVSPAPPGTPPPGDSSAIAKSAAALEELNRKIIDLDARIASASDRMEIAKLKQELAEVQAKQVVALNAKTGDRDTNNPGRKKCVPGDPLCVNPPTEIIQPVVPSAPTGTDPAQEPVSVPQTPSACNSYDTCNASCNVGVMSACLAVGHMLFTGNGGAPKDEARAYMLFVRACEGGEGAGCSNRGWQELAGKGTSKDGGRALASFELACNEQSTIGCFGVGVVLRGGHGPPADKARAKAAFQRACDAGGKDASKACQSRDEFK